MRLLSPALLLAILVVPTTAHAQAADSLRDVATLRALIVRSGEAFNARDPAAIMAPYARDIVLSYPGIPDQDYAMLEAAYREMTAPRPGVTVRTEPTIEEVLVSGDLAVIRVTWTTTTTEADPARESTRRLRDLQVWRREADGSWRFARGMHYRMTPPPAATSASAP